MLQSRYWDSIDSFQSAKDLLVVKCENMLRLIKAALQFRAKRYPWQAAILRTSIASIQAEIARLDNKAKDRQTLMLIEGRATRAYWSAFSILAHCPAGWKREYPHAKDPWNLALNIGYHRLTELLREEIELQHLEPTIGMLHIPDEHTEALVYDFEELFRQPIVDVVIHQLAARGHAERLTPAAIVFGMQQRLKEQWRRVHSVSWDENMRIEIIAYRQALISKSIYKPFCKK